MIYQNYNLNLIPDQVPLSVWCSQYDKDSRTFRFTIYKGGELFFIPSGSTVTVRGTKQDNTGFEYSCTFDGTVVDVVVKDQMTIFAGKVPCEIRITNGSDIIGTANFNLMVERTPLDTDVTVSETDLPLLEEAEQNAIRAEQAAERAEQAAVDSVKSVNNVLPDAQGNVDIVALPNGGTTGQVLTKQSSTDGDADWQSLPAKMDLVSSPTNGHLLATNSNGQAVDGGMSIEDLQGNIAVIETSPTTSSHAVGTYIVYNGILYKVTSAISANEQLVVGTNISATNVGSELVNARPTFTLETYSTEKQFPLNSDVQFSIDRSKSGWTAVACIIRHDYSTQMIVGPESVQIRNGRFIVAGFARNVFATGTITAKIYADVTWMKNI